MHLGILHGARADGLQVLEIPVPLARPLEARIEQPTHDLLIVRNVTITVQPKDMGLAGGMLVGDGEGCVAHGIILWIVLGSQCPKITQWVAVMP